MKIIITGGCGFLGQKLARALLNSNRNYDEILLVDITQANHAVEDPKIKYKLSDLTDPNNVDKIITEDTSLIFHLAAIVSSHAEEDFEVGWRVNLDTTRHLLEKCRKINSNIRFIFSSSIAAYGGNLPDRVREDSALTPQSSYGAQKAAGELLVNEYSRKGYVDARALRLPTVCVRPGKPNKAASSFVSGIVREPLNGQASICPVAPSLGNFITSPQTVVKNLIHMSDLEASELSPWPVLTAPGIRVTVEQMLDTLEDVAGPNARALVTFEANEPLKKIVESWATDFDTSRALSKGFAVDPNFTSILKQYIEHDMPQKEKNL